MEWIEGQSLQQQMLVTKFGQQEAVRIGIGILSGVAHLHSKGLVHRDLKLGNILLTSGAPRIAKIADFGSVAKVQAPTNSVAASGQTDLYRAPEGWGPKAHHERRSDLYKIGLVLHQIISGAFPSDGNA